MMNNLSEENKLSQKLKKFFPSKNFYLMTEISSKIEILLRKRLIGEGGTFDKSYFENYFDSVWGKNVFSNNNNRSNKSWISQN